MNTLSRAWQAWKRIAQVIGDFIGRIVLTFFYFTIFMPFGIGVRLFSDPLMIKPKNSKYWLERTNQDLSLDDVRRQY